MFLFLFYLLVRPKVDISGASNLIIEGNSVNLTCEIVAGRPKPEITWLKNGTEQEKSWVLLFPKIDKSDEGRYTCKAQNAAGIFEKEVKIFVKGEFVSLTFIFQISNAFGLSSGRKLMFSGPDSGKGVWV